MAKAPITLSLPAHKLLAAIETTSQLALWLHHLALQDGISHDILAVLWPHSGQPNALRSLPILVGLFGSAGIWYGCNASVSLVGGSSRAVSSVYHYVCGELVAAYVANEINSNATRSLVV